VTAIQDGRGLTAAAVPTDLDRRLAVGDVTSRIAVDRLSPDHSADDFVAMYTRVAFELGLTDDDHD
jgi:hypothetical protein